MSNLDNIPDTTEEDVLAALARGDKLISVTRSLFADAETPVGIYRKLAQDVPGSFLLESAEQGGIWSRFSFVGVSVYGVLTENGGAAQWLDRGLSVNRAFEGGIPASPLSALDKLYKDWGLVSATAVAPLSSGLVGYLGWETVRELENLPNAPLEDVPVPTISLSFVRELIIIDHKWGTVTLLVNQLLDEHNDGHDYFESAQRDLDHLQARLASSGEVGLARVDMNVAPHAKSRTEKSDFISAVDSAKQYILEGDIFQVVISQRFELDVQAHALDVYRVLRTLNPSPYMYLLCCEGADGRPLNIVGSSPEALVKVQSGRVYSHPIAGSRPRGTNPETDSANEADLLADQKELAEHLMLVDLARNDLLRVCDAGSVEVTEFMRIERFSHIMHIVSSVEGDLSSDLTAVDALKATFPAGTLSGAPKPRALEIIDELEPVRRGVYGGVVGYFGFHGDADLAIAIRTATIYNGKAYVQAGGGLVMDSVPEQEFQESVNKSAAPLKAVAIANHMVMLGAS